VNFLGAKGGQDGLIQGYGPVLSSAIHFSNTKFDVPSSP
jgi:hypothetical protein